MRNNEIDVILESILQKYNDISDIILTVGRPIQIISSGKFIYVNLDNMPIMSLTPFQTEIFAINILQENTTLMQQLIEDGSCDCSYHLSNIARFRANIFSQRNSYSIVLRILSTEIPTIKKLDLSSRFYEITQEESGLILITGGMGSGKSNTIAAMINDINEKEHSHIITLEDPIEFSHPHKESTINQRELGVDFRNFADGLQAALKQRPKVIFVGEMRDRETFEMALVAAETGHLVISSIYTNETAQSIIRILSMFNKEEEPFVRCRIADSVRWIVGQKLVPKIGGGRAAAVEIMKTNLRIKETIMNGETEKRNFYDIMTQSASSGMQTFDQSLIELFSGRKITGETALSYCTDRIFTSKHIEHIRVTKGIASEPSESRTLRPKTLNTRKIIPNSQMETQEEKSPHSLDQTIVKPPEANTDKGKITSYDLQKLEMEKDDE